jgi:glycosyltransferase involved in cell wall biosynthesis
MYDNKGRLAESGPPTYTVFTPTFNRRETLPHVFDSLLHQTYKSFEWIIVDDGSTDSTGDLIPAWLKTAPFRIRYYYQENRGAHVATNFAVTVAKGEHFVIFDSDDRFTSNALDVLQREWVSIPAEKRSEYKGITCRCIDPVTEKMVGSPLPYSPFDTNSIELRFRHRIKGEMVGSTLTEIMRRHPFPVFDEQARFCPESIVWFDIAREYKERIVDVGIRYYYRDRANALTGMNVNRAGANYHLWKYYLNDCSDYARYSPDMFAKALVGMSRDGFTVSKRLPEMLNDLDSVVMRALFVALWPAGYVLSRMRRAKPSVWRHGVA